MPDDGRKERAMLFTGWKLKSGEIVRGYYDKALDKTINVEEHEANKLREKLQLGDQPMTPQYSK